MNKIRKLDLAKEIINPLTKDCYQVISSFVSNQDWINFISVCKDFLSFNTKDVIAFRKRYINHLMKLVNMYPEEKWDIGEILCNPLFNPFESPLLEKCKESESFASNKYVNFDYLVKEDLNKIMYLFNPNFKYTDVIRITSSNTIKLSDDEINDEINNLKISDDEINKLIYSNNNILLILPLNMVDQILLYWEREDIRKEITERKILVSWKIIDCLLNNANVIKNIDYIKRIMDIFSLKEPNFDLSLLIDLNQNLDSIKPLIMHLWGLSLNKTLNEKYIRKIYRRRTNVGGIKRYNLSINIFKNYNCHPDLFDIPDHEEYIGAHLISPYYIDTIILTLEAIKKGYNYDLSDYNDLDPNAEDLSDEIIEHLNQIHNAIKEVMGFDLDISTFADYISQNPALSWDIIKKYKDLNLWYFDTLSRNTFGNLSI